LKTARKKKSDEVCGVTVVQYWGKEEDNQAIPERKQKITALITTEMHVICSIDNRCMHGRSY